MAERTRPPWNKDADYSQITFFIRRMDTKGRITVPERPAAVLPLVSFMYLSAGEVLIEVDGIQYLCSAGHLILIPPQKSFSIRYFFDSVGYTGAFRPEILLQAERIMQWTEPIHQAFWFDEAAFVGELFNMLVGAYEHEDTDFIVRGLDLLISRVRKHDAKKLPQMVSGFLKSVFSPSRPPQDLSAYAAEAFVTPGHLNRMVRKYTGKSVGTWIDIARLGAAKRLLRDTELPVAEVGAAVGLTDPSYFSRFFKRQSGMTPLDFRRKMHG